MKTFTLVVIMVAIVFPSAVVAHGTGGTQRSWESTSKKKYAIPESIFGDNLTSQDMEMETQFKLALKIEQNEVRLYVTNNSGIQIDISLASATVFFASDGRSTIFKLLPSDGNNYLVGILPTVFTKTIKLEIVLRIPGEKAINASFSPGLSEHPTKVSQ